MVASTLDPFWEKLNGRKRCGPPSTQWLVARALTSTSLGMAAVKETRSVKLVPGVNSVVERESIRGRTPRNKYGGSKASMDESSPAKERLAVRPAPPVAMTRPSGTSTVTL